MLSAFLSTLRQNSDAGLGGHQATGPGAAVAGTSPSAPAPPPAATSRSVGSTPTEGQALPPAEVLDLVLETPLGMRFNGAPALGYARPLVALTYTPCTRSAYVPHVCRTNRALTRHLV